MNDEHRRLPPSFLWNFGLSSLNQHQHNSSSIPHQPLISKSEFGSSGSGSGSNSPSSYSGSGSGSGFHDSSKCHQCQCHREREPLTAGRNVGDGREEHDILFESKIHYVLCATFVTAFGMLAFNVMEFVSRSLPFTRLTGHEFYDEDTRAVLLMTPKGHVQIFVVTMLLLSSFFCILVMYYTLKFGGYKGLNLDSSQLGYFPFCVKLSHFVTFLIMMSFAIQFWTYMKYSPDARRIEGTKLLMRVEMLSQNGSGAATPQWIATQQSYKCCGIDVAKEWLRGQDPDPRLPLSCCGKVWPWPIQNSVSGNDADALTNPVAALQKIPSDDFAGSPKPKPKCVLQEAYKAGCNDKILGEINHAATKALIELGFLSIFHFLLIWALEYIATQSRIMFRRNRCFIQTYSTATATSLNSPNKQFVI